MVIQNGHAGGVSKA